MVWYLAGNPCSVHQETSVSAFDHMFKNKNAPPISRPPDALESMRVWRRGTVSFSQCTVYPCHHRKMCGVETILRPDGRCSLHQRRESHYGQALQFTPKIILQNCKPFCLLPPWCNKLSRTNTAAWESLCGLLLLHHWQNSMSNDSGLSRWTFAGWLHCREQWKTLGLHHVSCQRTVMEWARFKSWCQDNTFKISF